jgi:hypothetical protein
LSDIIFSKTSCRFSWHLDFECLRELTFLARFEAYVADFEAEGASVIEQGLAEVACSSSGVINCECVLGICALC